MGKVGKGFVLLLDIDRVLSTDELLAVSAAASAREPQDVVNAGGA
jgi:hypothetical protein